MTKNDHDPSRDPQAVARDETVKDILSRTLNLAKELQRELGRLQIIVDHNLPKGGR